MTTNPNPNLNVAARPITILGAGHIGFALALMLRRAGGYSVRVADHDPQRLQVLHELGFEVCLIQGAADTHVAIAHQYAVLNALPFHKAVSVAQMCVAAGVHYFDLTEDVRSTQAIQALAVDAHSVLMPQCGLAPGFIGVLGHDLAKRFDSVDSLRLRVGALPRYPSNRLGYNLTWSTEGLINEYCNPCEALVDGVPQQVPALEGLETFAIDGMAYEAFNTSGGLGTLTHTLQGRARHVDYKSIRYPGHHAVMKLLLQDLRLAEKRGLLKDILEGALPGTDQDVVLVFATATGRREGRWLQESYAVRVLGDMVEGQRLSAIQRTTAAGMCVALDLVAQGQLPQAGFIGQEQIGLGDFLANRFGRTMAGESALDALYPGIDAPAKGLTQAQVGDLQNTAAVLR
ncbi:saccharopine dehydrogenase C-terminal domain-containing protein [Variovorax sp. HJSM1_2]|uniref:saccharopine dehydrogenase family protein n=1 Tax=Variovorax sp. HJSM1_2 TaxID=3366263 RepID=UPI003BE54414